MKRALVFAAVIALAVGCSDQRPLEPELQGVQPQLNAQADGLSMSTTVQFGTPNQASPFPPEEEHDASHHSADKIVPRTVTVAKGGSVTFQVAPVHQVAVYEPGTTPDDIDTTDTKPMDILPFLPVITDEDGRVALSPPHSFSESTWAETFDEPGRYLVICTTLVHFEDNDMYGWVIVK